MSETALKPVAWYTPEPSTENSAPHVILHERKMEQIKKGGIIASS